MSIINDITSGELLRSDKNRSNETKSLPKPMIIRRGILEFAFRIRETHPLAQTINIERSEEKAKKIYDRLMPSLSDSENTTSPSTARVNVTLRGSETSKVYNRLTPNKSVYENATTQTKQESGSHLNVTAPLPEYDEDAKSPLTQEQVDKDILREKIKGIHDAK